MASEGEDALDVITGSSLHIVSAMDMHCHYRRNGFDLQLAAFSSVPASNTPGLPVQQRGEVVGR